VANPWHLHGRQEATRVTEAFSGSGYVQNILSGEITDFAQRYRNAAPSPVDLDTRVRYNTNLTKSWLGAVGAVINSITMLSIILTGAALIREREHGTIEHLLVMTEIMLSKIWSMGLVVLAISSFSLVFVVRGALSVPIQGSLWLFIVGAALDLFATTAMGIALATIAASMPQFALLVILIFVTVADTVGQRVAAREHARACSHSYAWRAEYAFRDLGSKGAFSWRRTRCRVAAARRALLDRSNSFLSFAATLQGLLEVTENAH
jgi:hypothetical protein